MGRPLADVMSREVHTVQPETPAHEAAELMIERRIGALPVVDEQRRLLGIVTDMDFLTVARNALQGRLGWQLTQA
jgi:CBS domain-containing protein